jgi:Fur family ferric uptake transcriptional regulator
MEASEILKMHSLRMTQHRCEVLAHFMDSKRAISHADLEQVFKGKIDRVSLYRMLHSFSEKKILCKLIDSNGVVSYVFDEHSPNDHSHFHPHYKCKTCNDVVELPQLPESYMNQLKKLNIDELNILAEGTCDECQKTIKK